MRASGTRLATDDHGRLCVEVPRATYWAFAVVLALAAALMVTRWGEGVARGLDAPAWAWWGAMGVFIAFAVASGVQARWGHSLVFDAQRGAIVRGERIVARFAEMSHVELLERRATDGHRHWVLRIHCRSGRPIFLGRESSEEGADRAGARVATALGKPVKHVVR